MKHSEKIDWMILWAHKNKVRLELEGECGLGRECVGILAEGHYPDYKWYDEDWNRADNNGDVWIPDNAYHKHECVAVLGRGEVAEAQLYDWLKWFDDNNFKVEVSDKVIPKDLDPLIIMLQGIHEVRMVKQNV